MSPGPFGVVSLPCVLYPEQQCHSVSTCKSFRQVLKGQVVAIDNASYPDLMFKIVLVSL